MASLAALLDFVPVYGVWRLRRRLRKLERRLERFEAMTTDVDFMSRIYESRIEAIYQNLLSSGDVPASFPARSAQPATAAETSADGSDRARS